MTGYEDWAALVITLQLALISTAILLLLGTPFAWWLARSEWRYKFLLEAIVALPLVLPPTVLGFYLLVAFSPSGPIGQWTVASGIGSLAFTFSGLVAGSVIYSLPSQDAPLVPDLWSSWSLASGSCLNAFRAERLVQDQWRLQRPCVHPPWIDF